MSDSRPGQAAVVGTPAVLARAEAALTEAERAHFARYTFPKRRHDWLLGRWAAKLAAADACGCAPEAVEVASGEKGRPLFVTPDASLGGWDLSLTHGHGRAAAIVAPGPAGVDLEAMRDVPPGGWRFFLAEDERAWLQGQPLGPFGEIVFWAVKEAAYKALHGEVDAMPKLRVAVDAAAGRARVTHAGGTVEARWCVKDGFCLAVAAPAPAPGWLARIAPEALVI